MTGLVLALALALVYGLANSLTDSANALAAVVSTRAARPAQAVSLVAVFEFVGVMLAGTAVANTVAGITHVPQPAVVATIGAALTGALAWSAVTWWRGLPSSSSHALVGGLVGAALLTGGGSAVTWGTLTHLRPAGVAGVMASLAVSPALGFLAALLLIRLAKRLTRRARRAIEGPIRKGEWVTSATLALSHGANDAQKTMGVITLLLVARGHLAGFTVPLWVKIATAVAFGLGTSIGGWRIVRTVGSGIYRISPLDGLVSQGASALIILSAGALGGPVSTTHVVASSVVGVGTAQRKRHVRWAVAREMAAGWLLTLPAAGVLSAAAVPLWRLIT